MSRTITNLRTSKLFNLAVTKPRPIRSVDAHPLRDENVADSISTKDHEESIRAGLIEPQVLILAPSWKTANTAWDVTAEVLTVRQRRRQPEPVVASIKSYINTFRYSSQIPAERLTWRRKRHPAQQQNDQPHRHQNHGCLPPPSHNRRNRKS
jgi:hypothetical protein